MMASADQPKQFVIKPSWKHFFWPYVLSVITIPIGIGLIALYYVRRRHRSIKYQITNTQISKIDQKYEHHVDLVDIEKIESLDNWWHKKLGIGTLRLHTSTSTMDLTGLINTEKISAILEQAIQSQQKMRKKRQETQEKKSDFKPGSMDRIEYLTGLWQQGLISDADYEAEREQFK